MIKISSFSNVVFALMVSAVSSGRKIQFKPKASSSPGPQVIAHARDCHKGMLPYLHMLGLRGHWHAHGLVSFNFVKLNIRS
jgi:hypothetical protein